MEKVRKNKFRILFNSFLFQLIFYSWTSLICIFLSPALIFPRIIAVKISKFWAHSSLVLLKIIVGITHEVRGLENLKKDFSLISSKHQSTWETIAFWVLTEEPIYFLKRELLFIPFFGWFLFRLGMIDIDRKKGSSQLKSMIRRSKQTLRDRKKKLIIFPEGTRTIPGKKSQYQVGIVGLYSSLKIPVVPVALNSGLYWPRRTFLKYPGKIIVEFLPPIDPNLTRSKFFSELKRKTETASLMLLKK